MNFNKVFKLNQGYNCCSDSIIAAHYMPPRDVLRLDIAIQTQQNIIDMYKKHTKLNKRVAFKDIIKNYILLEDFEFGGRRLQEFLNSNISKTN